MEYIRRTGGAAAQAGTHTVAATMFSAPELCMHRSATCEQRHASGTSYDTYQQAYTPGGAAYAGAYQSPQATWYQQHAHQQQMQMPCGPPSIPKFASLSSPMQHAPMPQPASVNHVEHAWGGEGCFSYPPRQPFKQVTPRFAKTRTPTQSLICGSKCTQQIVSRRAKDAAMVTRYVGHAP